MQFYLPIAEISINGFLPICLGLLVGFLSGLFGVGGGFLMTPLLIFSGIPPAVAVGTQANQLVAASASGFWTYWKQKRVDFKMGSYLMLGGLVGSFIGVMLFSLLQYLGQIDFVISLAYVLLLGGIGGYMLKESLTFMRHEKRKLGRGKLRQYKWVRSLPYRTRFPESKMYISALVPAGLGFITGIAVSIMGIGGGFIMAPVMIYLLGMPTMIVPGTNLFQITIVMAFTTLIHAVQNHTVDLLLAVILLLGSVMGAQVGSQVGLKVKSEYLRLMLALVVMALCIKMFFELTATPDEIFQVVIR